MPHATGLRIVGALCFFTIVLSPLGVIFWWLARKKEKEREKELARLETIQENTQ